MYLLNLSEVSEYFLVLQMQISSLLVEELLKKDSNFKIVDCLDYNEKQISEKLIGKENIFLENNHGLILIKNVNVVSKDLISNVIRMLKNNSDFDFILICSFSQHIFLFFFYFIYFSHINLFVFV